MHSTRKIALVLTPLALTALAALGLAAAPAARAAVYVVGSGNEFGTLNLSDGSFNYISTLTTTDTITGLGFVNGTLYGLGDNPTTDTPGLPTYTGPYTDVFTIDATTGADTPKGTISGFTAATATAGNGVFYSLNTDTNASHPTPSDALDSLDPNSLTASSVNASTGIYSDGLLIEQGGTLYAADINNTAGTGTDALDGINPSTGAVTPVGDTGVASDFNLLSGVSDGGVLYGFGNDGNIYTFDTGNGAATQGAAYALIGGDSVVASAEGPADSPAPEPSQYGMLALMGLGLGGLLLRARRHPRAD